MKEKLRGLWKARTPRERLIVGALAPILGVLFYVWFVHSAGEARTRLQTGVTALREQAVLLQQQAVEVERLRAAPAITPSRTDLHTLLQAQIGAAGLSRALVKIDALDVNQVTVVFGAVAFADWLNWVAGLASQQVRLKACRIETLSTAGLVSVTATLVRTKT